MEDVRKAVYSGRDGEARPDPSLEKKMDLLIEQGRTADFILGFEEGWNASVGPAFTRGYRMAAGSAKP